jgi:hypothetical protein
MKILEIISKIPLIEMAIARSDAKKTTLSLSEPIVDHLYKMFVVNSPDAQRHWKKELNAWIKKINNIRLKPSSSKPSKEDLYDWITDYQRLTTVNYLSAKINEWQDEYKLHNEIDHEFVVNHIAGLLNLICRDISANKYINIQQYIE